MIKDYRLLADSNETDLNDKVRSLVDKGWEPYGYPNFVVQPNEPLKIFQAMVKYDT